MWQALWNFWYPTPEIRAAQALPTLAARLGAELKAAMRWSVIWRRAVAIYALMFAINFSYFAIRGIETVAMERQKDRLMNPSFPTDDSMRKYGIAIKAQAEADQALATYYCSIGVRPRNAGLNLDCGPWDDYR